MTANADRNSVTAMMINVSAMGPAADTIPFDKERREREGESKYLRNFDGQRLRSPVYLSCQVANCSDDCYDIHNPTSDLGDKEHMREKLLLFAVRVGAGMEGF